MAQSTSTSVISIVREDGSGNVVSGAAPYFIRASKFDTEDVTKPIFDDTFTGDYIARHQAVPGTIHSKISFTMAAAVDTIGFALFGVTNYYGAQTVDGALAHAGFVNGAPAVFRISTQDGQGNNFYYSNCVFESVKITGSDDKLVEVECSLLGMPSVVDTDASAISWTTEGPIPTWSSFANLSYVQFQVESYDIEIKRDVKPIFTASGDPLNPFGSTKQGGRAPYAWQATTVEVTGKVTALADSAAYSELSNFVQGASSQFSVALLPSEWQPGTGTGTGTFSVQVICSNVAYTSGKIVRGGTKDVLKAEFDFEALAAQSSIIDGVLTPLDIFVTNAVPTIAYGANGYA
jgi:hypothetical protein